MSRFALICSVEDEYGASGIIGVRRLLPTDVSLELLFGICARQAAVIEPMLRGQVQESSHRKWHFYIGKKKELLTV